MWRANAQEVALGEPHPGKSPQEQNSLRRSVSNSRDAGKQRRLFLRLCPGPRGSPGPRLFPGPSTVCQCSKPARGPDLPFMRNSVLAKTMLQPAVDGAEDIPTKKPIYKWHRIRVLAENRLRPARKLPPGQLQSNGPHGRKRRRSPFSSVLVDGPQGCRMQFTENRKENCECSQSFGRHHPRPNHNPRGRLQLKKEPLVRRDCGPRGDVCRSPTMGAKLNPEHGHCNAS